MDLFLCALGINSISSLSSQSLNKHLIRPAFGILLGIFPDGYAGSSTVYENSLKRMITIENVLALLVLTGISCQ